MERFKLVTKDGQEVNLSFSMFFLSRCSQLLGLGLQELFPAILGTWDENKVSGGMIDNLHTRAVVLAAGMEAFGFENGDYTKKTEVDGYNLMNSIPNSLLNPVWGEMFNVVSKSMIADGMPKEGQESKPKKTVKKRPALRR